MPVNTIPIFNYHVTNKLDGVIDVHIDGDIVDASTQEIMKNWWGDETSVSFKSFRNQIETANPSTLNIYINSTGGHVGDAMAMHDYLQELETKGVTINRRGRGIIASAATYLLIGNNSEMSANSFMMIHNVFLIAAGDINSVENQVRAGRKFNDKIRDFYANKTANAPETISKWMNQETWFTAQEAKDKGFVSSITGEVNFTNQIPDEFFPYLNKSILNKYNSFTKNNDMSKTIKDSVTEAFNAVLDKLGLSNKKEEQLTVDAVAEFSTAVENAVNGAKITDEALGIMINTAVTEAVKNLVNKDDVASIVTPLVSNFASKTDLTNQLTALKTEIVNAIADKSGSSSSGEPQPVKTKKTGNKYSGMAYSEATVN